MCRPSILIIMHIILFSLSILSGTVLSSDGNPCSSMAPGTSTGGKPLPLDALFMRYGYLQTQGKKNPAQNSYSTSYEETQAEFVPSKILETSTDGVLYVEARLFYQTRNAYRRAFDLTGFWSRADGKLCMVGFGTGYGSRGNHTMTTFQSVLKLNFKSNPTILTSLISGTLESMGVGDDHSDPIAILGYNQNHYNYTLASQASDQSRVGVEEEERGLSLESNKTMCSTMKVLEMYELEYETSCVSADCNPLGKDIGFLPRFMEMNVVGCTDEGELNMYLTFSNSTFSRRAPPFLPDLVLLGEGLWDWGKNELRVAACRIVNSSAPPLTGSYVGDCSVRMSLRVRETLSIRNRGDAAGEIWSTKTKNESGYFDPVSFQSVGKSLQLSPKYEYTMVNSSEVDCTLKENGVVKSHNIYPNPVSYASDLRFLTSIRGSGSSRTTFAYFTPEFLGSRPLRRDVRMGLTERFAAKLRGFSQKLWNISYAIQFNSPPNAKWVEFLSFQTSNYNQYRKISAEGVYNYRKISAEGVYNSDTGLLCMVGCRYLPTNLRNLSGKFDSYDCEISVNVQFPPVNGPSYNAHLNGSIRSRRDQSDPLYFEPLIAASYISYARQFRRMAKRMDFEFIMVIVSLTLTCVFVASQLFYVKKHPEALPSVSILMLGVLTLGLMIPLVLNFEALFVNGKSVNRRSSSTVILRRSGGWLEAKEVVVRALTMVAFLLQCWLLQRTVSAKLAQEQHWLGSEGRVLKWCIPLYFVGALIALLLHFMNPKRHHSLWEYLLSYAGLILDGFLLPQVLLSLFSRSKGKVLAVSFYVGMTLVRSLPHAYDAYRGRYYRSRFRASYHLYADHRRDFYSTSWDVVIPCGAVVLSVLTFVQQKFGGPSIVPPRFRRLAGYEEVPVVDGVGSTSEVELQ